MRKIVSISIGFICTSLLIAQTSYIATLYHEWYIIDYDPLAEQFKNID